jgi:hypothetical protein
MLELKQNPFAKAAEFFLELLGELVSCLIDGLIGF